MRLYPFIGYTFTDNQGRKVYIVSYKDSDDILKKRTDLAHKGIENFLLSNENLNGVGWKFAEEFENDDAVMAVVSKFYEIGRRQKALSEKQASDGMQVPVLKQKMLAFHNCKKTNEDVEIAGNAFHWCWVNSGSDLSFEKEGYELLTTFVIPLDEHEVPAFEKICAFEGGLGVLASVLKLAHLRSFVFQGEK